MNAPSHFGEDAASAAAIVPHTSTVRQAMIAVEGERLHDKTWVRITEVQQGWGFGGTLLGAADVQALKSAA